MKNMKRIIVMILGLCIIFNTFVYVQAESENSNSSRGEAMRIILSELSIMQGDPNGNMRYEDVVSRAEFAKVAVMSSAYRDYVVPEMKLTVFPDVKGDNWCSPYVWTGVKHSMFSGYPDGTFKPGDMVSYEEAANVFLRILGYTDEDIGPSWPYGPVALASNIGLAENIDAFAGKVLTRYDVANMVYNMLNSSPKGEAQEYIAKLGYSIFEDTMLIASYAEDTSVGANNVYTSAGTFEMGYDFNRSAIGMRGDLVVENSSEAVCLIPSGQNKVTYTVTDVMGGGLMLNDNLFNIDENTTVYYGKSQYTYKDLYMLSIQRGDEFSLIYTKDGYIDYALLSDKSKTAELSELTVDKCVVYSTVNGNIVFYKDSLMTTYDISDNTNVYKDEVKLSYGDIKNQLEMGDVLYVTKDSSSNIKYVKYEEGKFVGPILANDGAWQDGIGVNIEKASVLRNGVKVSKEEIGSDDVIYYCKDLNLILAYYKTVTGVYEKASPNRDTPTSVTISGKTYSIEGIDAFNKLSSKGNIVLGDTITVVLGKDGKIADVFSNDTSSMEVYGYLIETGTGVYEKDDGSEYSAQCIKIVTSDGEVCEYTASKDYSSYENKIVRATISDGKAVVTPYTAATEVYGNVNWSNRSIGNYEMSNDISILDVRTVDKNKTAAYKTVFPQRLDGTLLKNSDVHFAKMDENRKITELILADVTADSWSYGIISETISSRGTTVGYKIYNKDTMMQTDITGIGGIGVGKGVRMSVTERGIENVWLLNAISNPSEITRTKVIGTTTHTISDSVEVYVRSGNFSTGYTYNYIELSQVTGIDKSKIIAAYYDEADSSGGRVRVIVVSE